MQLAAIGMLSFIQNSLNANDRRLLGMNSVLMASTSLLPIRKALAGVSVDTGGMAPFKITVLVDE